MPALAHLGVGLVTKRFAPKIPLWVLLVGSMFLDLLYMVFIFAPAKWITHGIFMGIVWSVVATIGTVFIIKYLNSKQERGEREGSILPVMYTSLIIGLLVFSHLLLDFIGWPMTVGDPNATGVPILFDDAQNIGLGVYTTLIGAIGMDLGFFIVGLLIYLQTRKELSKSVS